MMLQENPLVHAAAVLSVVQSPAYWELHVPYTMSRLFLSCRSWCGADGMCVVYTDCWRPVHSRGVFHSQAAYKHTVPQ